MPKKKAEKKTALKKEKAQAKTKTASKKKSDATKVLPWEDIVPPK